MKPREDGRAVRVINTDDLMPELSNLEDVLHGALIEAPHDPAELITRIGQALRHVKRAKWASQEIEEACKRAAKRGTYKKGETSNE